MFFKDHLKRISVLFLAVLLAVQPFCGAFRSRAQTGTVNTDRLNLRSGPGISCSCVAVLTTNTRVSILSSQTGSDGFLWYQVSTGGKQGWLRSDYINTDVTYSISDAGFEAWLTEQGFPESYRNALRGLHEKHPSWVFLAQQTGLDWETAAAEESRIGRNLVETEADSSWKSTEDGAFDWAGNYWPGFDGSAWVAASSALIRHYMDPRNFLTEPYVYQFQLQTYDPETQTREGLLRMVKGTFLEGTVGQKTGSSSDSSGGPGVYTGSSLGPGVSGNTYGSNSSGGSFSNGSSSGGGTAAGNGGPGTGPASDTASYQGPSGTSGTSASTQAPSGTSGASGSSFGTGTSSLPVLEYRSETESSLFSLFGGITARADWQLTDGNWVWLQENGSRLSDGWHWLDGNGDGISECYYFDRNGIMARDTQIGEYTVNSDGKWTEGGVIQTKVSGSTSSGTLYADLLMEAARQSGVSPYVLAAMILQEQGTDGSSPMISGTAGGYSGIYNFYNIGAYEHDGLSAVEAGLRYASEAGNGNRPWNTVEKAIIGGALAYGANYTDSGQDTFYLKKFNVQGSNLYQHQFMTNTVAAAQEGAKLSDAYTDEIRNSALVFRIPVYNGMPETPCELPVGTGSPNNRLLSLTVDGFSLTPTFRHETTEYSLIVDSSVQSICITAQTADRKAAVAGDGTIQLGTGLNEILLTVTAENGDQRGYRISVTRRASEEASGPGAVTGSAGPVSEGPGTAQSSEGNPSSGETAESGADTEPAIVIGGPPM